MLDLDTCRFIESVLFRYARALDERDWPLLDQVFLEDANVRYGDDPERRGRDDIVAGIRAYLDDCGPTQHLIGNVEAWPVDGGIESRCLVQAAHASHDGARYLATLGRYRTIWRKTEEGWRIAEFRMLVDLKVGDDALLFGEAAE